VGQAWWFAWQRGSDGEGGDHVGTSRQLGDRRPKTAYNRAEILVGLGQRAWDEGDVKMATTSWVRAQDLYRTAGTSYRRSSQRIAQLEDRLR